MTEMEPEEIRVSLIIFLPQNTSFNNLKLLNQFSAIIEILIINEY
jgi:hypothetical protein